MSPPCSGYAHDPSPGDAPGLPSDARMLLVQSLVEEEEVEVLWQGMTVSGHTGSKVEG